eukprot:1633428-Prymnesium_polylepis.1
MQICASATGGRVREGRAVWDWVLGSCEQGLVRLQALVGLLGDRAVPVVAGAFGPSGWPLWRKWWDVPGTDRQNGQSGGSIQRSGPRN